jgi:hypothetical protein
LELWRRGYHRDVDIRIPSIFRHRGLPEGMAAGVTDWLIRGELLPSTSAPLPFNGYPFLMMTLASWI